MYVCFVCKSPEKEEFETREQFEAHIISVAGSSYSPEPIHLPKGKILKKGALEIEILLFLRDSDFEGLKKFYPLETIMTQHYSFDLEKPGLGHWGSSLGIYITLDRLKMLNDFARTYKNDTP